MLKELRALCDCGFVTRKARSGYHRHQWWFPVLSTDTGTLTDVLAALPKDDRDRIDQQSFEVYKQTPSDNKEARRVASAKMKTLSREIHDQFIERETPSLRDRFASRNDCVFNPAPDTDFRCPACNNNTLILKYLHVIAFCKADCGHEYSEGPPRSRSSKPDRQANPTVTSMLEQLRQKDEEKYRLLAGFYTQCKDKAVLAEAQDIRHFAQLIGLKEISGKSRKNTVPRMTKQFRITRNAEASELVAAGWHWRSGLDSGCHGCCLSRNNCSTRR